jgi:hypothetical protein
VEAFRDVRVYLPHVAWGVVGGDALAVVNADEAAYILPGADGAHDGLTVHSVEMEVQMVSAVKTASAMEFVTCEFHYFTIIKS